MKRVDSEAKAAGRQLLSDPPVAVPVAGRSEATLGTVGEVEETPFASVAVVGVGFNSTLTIRSGSGSI